MKPAAAIVGCALALATAAGASSAIRIRTFRFIDHSRTITSPGGRRIPRPLVTVVRFPAAPGRYPLVVFGHGFALSPADYAPLLNAWATAGFVVAAPVFPLGNRNAPGGPRESDIVNQPRDMRFVITRVLAVLKRSVDAGRIAVAGHSDGAVTALAVAYGARYRDRRVDAAIVMSGATLAGMGAFAKRGPPLLATQGTADPINAPANTSAYFAEAPRPKFLLWLEGASHRLPYTTEQPQLGLVERVTIAFLDHYLKGRSLRALVGAARPAALARLIADP